KRKYNKAELLLWRFPYALNQPVPKTSYSNFNTLLPAVRLFHNALITPVFCLTITYSLEKLPFVVKLITFPLPVSGVTITVAAALACLSVTQPPCPGVLLV